MRSYGGRNNGAFILAAVVAFAIVVIGLASCSSYAKVSTQHFKITGKESVSTKSGHEYRVYTSIGTYTVGDSLVHPRFNSSDVYGRLVIGKTYDCRTYGWRFGLFSMFKNILNCKETSADAG